MSEQEKNSGGNAQVGSVIMVEKTTSSRHSKPCRPSDDSDLHHRRSKAPVVPSEELKHVAGKDSTEIEERKECEHEISPAKHKHSVAKKLSSSTKKREPSPESIPLATLEVDKKKPIPPDVQSDPVPKEKKAAKNTSKDDDDDSITDEIRELQTPEMAKKHSEWSDDEEAGGLPRTDSRASRVSRAVQKLFCCGMTYDAPSEDNISTHRGYPI
ncbi:uncharacterized protein LOC123872357 [Maniola jurtina]|uniref:uncharacterized protein LOC123872357 n=1 Tax=Maniola jurtina TaxID=191418 RepID=UPI001E6885BA|nr:uncharacterized protein LOC123872357 [Maniola jurtina]